MKNKNRHLPIIGIAHRADIIQTMPIMANARFFVRLQRYFNGERIDQ